jgi:hypothetical protein
LKGVARHLVALSAFVGACIGGAVVFDVSEDGRLGYTLLCGFVFLPLAAAVWAFLSSRFSPPVVWTSTPEEVARMALYEEVYRSALPEGVSWVFPPHEPGRCNGPETPRDHLVPD